MIHMGDDFSRLIPEGRHPSDQSGTPDWEDPKTQELGPDWESEATDSTQQDTYEKGLYEPEDL